MRSLDASATLPRSGSRVRAPSPAPDFLGIIVVYAAPPARVCSFCFLGERPGEQRVCRSTQEPTLTLCKTRSSFVEARIVVEPNDGERRLEICCRGKLFSALSHHFSSVVRRRARAEINLSPNRPSGSLLSRPRKSLGLVRLFYTQCYVSPRLRAQAKTRLSRMP